MRLQLHGRYPTLTPGFSPQFSWIAFLYSRIHTPWKAGGFTSACKLETSVMQLKRCIWKPKVPFIPAQRTLSASFNQFLLILLLLSSYVLILSCGHKHPLVLNYAAIFTFFFFNKFDMWKKRNDLLHLLISMEWIHIPPWSISSHHGLKTDLKMPEFLTIIFVPKYKMAPTFHSLYLYINIWPSMW